MEAIEKNNASNTHQEKAKKLRKLRRWQIAVSLLGAAIVVWGIVEVACLFLGYNRTETSNDAQIEQYISPINLRASRRFILPNIKRYIKAIRSLYWTTANIRYA